MNLFENLQLMKESHERAEEIVDHDILKDYGIDFYERGNGELVFTTTDDPQPINVEVEHANGKWFVTLPTEDINTVDTDLTSAIIKAVTQIDDMPPQITPGRKSKLESSNKLWDKFVHIYNGFVPIKDLVNYFSLAKFGEFVQWCRHEADISYDYDKRYYNWDEALKDLDEATGVAESISLENIFNFFTTDDLTEFWNWAVREYDIDDGLEESVKLEKLSISNKLQTVFDKFDSNIKLVEFMLRYIDEDTVEKMYNEIAGVEESTSGIGGAYTTKAIDILPTRVKKVNENLYDEYLERVMDEKSNVELVNILHEIKDNKELKSEDKKKLEDEIKTKVRTIKTEAITEFYGKEWSDEEIQNMINTTKENPGIEMVADPNEVAYPLNYNGKDYWLIGEEKEIVFDGKDCVVVLTVDEDLNRYLTYFEYTLYDDGDGESGPQELKMDVSGVPYKMVAV